LTVETPRAFQRRRSKWEVNEFIQEVKVRADVRSLFGCVGIDGMYWGPRKM